MDTELGKLERVDLRHAWKHEALDFTPWLAQEENLNMLGEAIGIDMVLEEKESPVGDFNVDLYAKEEITNRRIIIENQLEDTNHDHLGKLIVYASGKEAEVIVWIVKKARDEHRKAIEWLNQHTDDKCAFFLIELELWKINNSHPAPVFNVIERPNDWAKTIVRTLTEREKLRLDFWDEFNKNAENNEEFTEKFNLRSPLPNHFYDLAVGSSIYHICMTFATQKKAITAGIYIQNNKEIFQRFKENEDKLKEILGCSKIEWTEAKRDSRFLVSKSLDVNNRDTWLEGFTWLYDQCVKIKKAVDVIMK